MKLHIPKDWLKRKLDICDDAEVSAGSESDWRIDFEAKTISYIGGEQTALERYRSLYREWLKYENGNSRGT